MSDHVRAQDLLEWCRIPAEQLPGHAGLRVPFRLVKDSAEMGELMARELLDLVAANDAAGRETRVILPCGPACWYEPWTRLVNARGLPLGRLSVFHMDECLDWQGRPLPERHPYNFRSFMEQRFYAGIRRELQVPPRQRHWLLPATVDAVRAAIEAAPIDLTLGGWGQDGHLAYNQARRHPFHHVTLDELDAGHARVPLGEQGQGLQRHGRLEADGAAGRAVRRADARVPDDALAAAPRRPGHRDARYGPPPDRRAPGVGAAVTPQGPDAPYRRLVGVGGIGTGLCFALEGSHDLGREESRPARLLDVRDYCKLHIVAHYPAVLLRARPSGTAFHVVPVGCVGHDEAGRRLRQEMAAAGMDTHFVRVVSDRPTLFSVCFQYPDGTGGNITTSNSAASALGAADVDAVARLLDRRTLALALPEAPLEERHRLLRLAGAAHALRVSSLASTEIDAARERGYFADVDLLALNAHEAAALAGTPFAPDAPQSFLDRLCGAAHALAPAMRLVLTAGRHGAFAYDGSRWGQVPALPVSVAGSAGAGDALLGGVLVGLVAGLPLVAPGASAGLARRPLASALDLGVLLAAFKLGSPHTIPPDLTPSALAAFAEAHAVGIGPELQRLLEAPSLQAPGGR
jgi:sugar/nucleoside kinase (ribokinase family)/6-phosphogluconolactonase/glucosamine-6-phosphate isomerase/deaminase